MKPKEKDIATDELSNSLDMNKVYAQVLKIMFPNKLAHLAIDAMLVYNQAQSTDEQLKNKQKEKREERK